MDLNSLSTARSRCSSLHASLALQASWLQLNFHFPMSLPHPPIPLPSPWSPHQPHKEPQEGTSPILWQHLCVLLFLDGPNVLTTMSTMSNQEILKCSII